MSVNDGLHSAPTQAHESACEELLEHWQRHPRVTFADFERQWQAQHDEMDLAE